MLNLREVILNCRDIPVVERYLLYSVINDSDLKVDISGKTECLFSFTITDGEDFVMELEYNTITNSSELIEVTGLDMIMPSINFNKMAESFILSNGF